MYKYAQIDDTGHCVSVSHLSTEVDAPHMIALSADDEVQPSDIYEDGVWTRPDTPPQPELEPSDKDRIEALETENAELWYETMIKDAKLTEHDGEIADLWYTIMTGGMSA